MRPGLQLETTREKTASVLEEGLLPPGRPVSPHHGSQLAVRSPLAWFPREVFQRVVWIDQLSERWREEEGELRAGRGVERGCSIVLLEIW